MLFIIVMHHIYQKKKNSRQREKFLAANRLGNVNRRDKIWTSIISFIIEDLNCIEQFMITVTDIDESFKVYC